jgi:hypothetical protein
MAKNHDFNFDGGEYIRITGATWFVFYSFYSLRDKTHKKITNKLHFLAKIFLYSICFYQYTWSCMMAVKYEISIIGGPKMKKIIAMLLLFSTMVFAQQKGTFTDPRDNKTYKTVKIVSQTWMAENLNYAASGSKCYDDKPENCKKYGRLYDWDAAMRVCPYGWHLPSDYEWDVLMAAVDGTERAGEKLKAKSGWNNSYQGKSGNGTDQYGFSALPGG